jgi:hypothetical protein
MWQAADQAYRFAYAKSVAVIESEPMVAFHLRSTSPVYRWRAVTSWIAVLALSFPLLAFYKSGAHHGLHETVSRTG